MDEQNNEVTTGELDQIETQVNNNLQVKDRYAKLSEKMTLEAKGRAEAEAKVKAEADARTKAEKERDFYKDFSQVSSKYPTAVGHQDKILELVNKGYTTEHATLAVLNESGNFKPITSNTNPAGGSASTSMTDMGDKSIEEMGQEERRKALQDLEKQGINLLKL